MRSRVPFLLVVLVAACSSPARTGLDTADARGDGAAIGDVGGDGEWEDADAAGATADADAGVPSDITGADVASPPGDADVGSDAENADAESADAAGPELDLGLDADAGPDADTGLAVVVVINEIGCEGPDFVELYNPGDRALALDGFAITDDASRPDRAYVFGAVDIGRGDFVTVFRSEDGGDGFGFGIRCGGDRVELLGLAGEVIDALEVPEMPASPATACLLPDGAPAWTFCVPTPGEPNVALDPRTPDDWFASFEVRRLDLTVPRASWRALEADPYTYVEATLAMDSEGIGPLTVGLRLKGQIGSFRGLDDKPAFKIDINRLVPGQLFFGLEKLTLNNMVQDRSLVHELAAYTLFGAMGVPSPRVTYVDLYIDGEPFGLYLSVESFDDVALERWFDTTTHLYEGEYGQDLYPDHVNDFEVDEGDPDDRSDLRELAEQIDFVGTDALYPLTLDTIDWGEVTRMMATELWIGHWDGYAPTRNNYFFHFDGDGVLTLLPWGTDQTFDVRLGLYDGRGLLFRACRANDECFRRYLEALVEVGDRVEELDLVETLIAVEAAIRPVASVDPRRWYSMESHDEQFAVTLDFLRERPAELAEQSACFLGPDPDPDDDGAPCYIDCAPDDPAIHPGAEDICGDSVDQDCSGLADDAPECPDCVETSLPGLDSTYWICPGSRTFADAVLHCISVGAELVQIDSAEENLAVWEAAMAVREQNWWLGLTDLADEGSWTWIDGTELTYTAWQPGEPNDWGEGEDCGAYWRSSGWNDVRCDSDFGVLCEEAG